MHHNEAIGYRLSDFRLSAIGYHMINPFLLSSIIPSVAEQATYQAMAEREEWMVQCLALGATEEQARAYDRDAQRYAATMPFPNHETVAHARQLALQALAFSEEMPASAEEAVGQAEVRARARLVRGGL
jgi:hypothetical protein